MTNAVARLLETTIRAYDPASGGDAHATAAIEKELSTGPRSRYTAKLPNGVRLVVDFERKPGFNPDVRGEFFDDSGKYGRERRLQFSPLRGPNVAHVVVSYGSTRRLPDIQQELATTIAHELGHYRSPAKPNSDEHYRSAPDGTEYASSEMYRMTPDEVQADAAAIRELLLRDGSLTFEEAAMRVLKQIEGLASARRMLRDKDYLARLQKQVRR